LEALTAQLEALSRSNPVLMIFEDLQWVDPTSLEVLDRAVGPDKDAASAADGYLPPGGRGAVGWTTSRHGDDSQSAR
jgi:hypothetical protein